MAAPVHGRSPAIIGAAGLGQFAGTLTAGTGGATDLVIYNNQNTITINSVIADNGGGVVSLVKSGAGTLTLQPSLFVTNAANTAGSAVVTVPDATGVTAGMAVGGPGILGGTTVLSVVGNVITLSAATTAPVTTLQVGYSNTYTGGTVVSAGVLQMGASNAMPPFRSLTVNGGTFDLNGYNQMVGTLSGSGGTIDLGTATLTLIQPSEATYHGVIVGTGALDIQAGGGVRITLTGANTYTGTTEIIDGTLALGGAERLAAGGSLLVRGGILSQHPAQRLRQAFELVHRRHRRPHHMAHAGTLAQRGQQRLPRTDRAAGRHLVEHVVDAGDDHRHIGWPDLVEQAGGLRRGDAGAGAQLPADAPPQVRGQCARQAA